MPSRERITPDEIREWRHSLGLSQPQAAKALGIPTGTYRNWEQGQQRVANPQLLRGMMRCIRDHGHLTK